MRVKSADSNFEMEHPFYNFKPFEIYWLMMQDGVEKIEIPIDIFIVEKFDVSMGFDRYWKENHREKVFYTEDYLPQIYEDVLSLCDSKNYRIISVSQNSITIRKNNV